MNTKNIIPFLFLYLLSFQVNSQDKDVVIITDEFDHIIGKEFSDISELGDFNQTSWTSSHKDGIERRFARLLTGPYTIYTSELVSAELNTGKKIRKILDLIILNGDYGSCGGCLSSNNRNFEIKTIHPVGEMSKETITTAFEINKTTGKFRQVNPKYYEWNTKSDRLIRKN